MLLRGRHRALPESALPAALLRPCECPSRAVGERARGAATLCSGQGRRNPAGAAAAERGGAAGGARRRVLQFPERPRGGALSPLAVRLGAEPSGCSEAPRGAPPAPRV